MTNVRELTPELAKQAEAELNEVSSKKTDEDLQKLREWIGKQAHLTARLGEAIILMADNMTHLKFPCTSRRSVPRGFSSRL